MKATIVFALVPFLLALSATGQGSWQTSNAISTVSSYRGATAVFSDGDEDMMYVFGGWTTSSGNFNETSVYNFSDDTWSAGSTIPENTRGGSAICIDDDIYLLCGHDGVDNNINSKIFLKYNITADNWDYLAEYPVAARYVAMAYNSNNGLIYCAGGSGDSYSAVDEVNAYDPEANSWISCTSLPFPSSGGSALVFEGNHLYLLGGLIYQPYDKLFKGLVSIDDPATINWSLGASIPVEMAKISAGYIGNGELLASDLTGTFMYDISTDIWTIVTDKPILVKGGNFASILIGNAFNFAIAGGKSVDELLVDHVEYFTAEENVKFPATFVVNFFSGGAVTNAEIEVASTTIYTDESGSAVLYLEDGTYDYTATLNDLITGGTFTIDGEREYIDVQLPVFVEEQALNFKIYPNPSEGLLFIRMENLEINNSTLNIRVVDLLGKPVYQGVMDDSGLHQFDLSQLNKGVYFVIISDLAKNEIIRKVVLD